MRASYSDKSNAKITFCRKVIDVRITQNCNFYSETLDRKYFGYIISQLAIFSLDLPAAFSV